MESDLIIRRASAKWRAIATSDLGKLFAEKDTRFNGHEAELTASSVTAMFAEMSGGGMLVRLPDGLPGSRTKSLLLRLGVALLILLPGLFFLGLVLS